MPVSTVNKKLDTIRVLHVDDSTDYLLLARYRLSKLSADLQIDSAENATDALNAINSNEFTCVLCDMHLPDMDGLSLLKTLRSTGNSTPFIFLSATSDDRIREKLLQHGADAYQPKELDAEGFDRLLERIRTIAGNRRKR